MECLDPECGRMATRGNYCDVHSPFGTLEEQFRTPYGRGPGGDPDLSEEEAEEEAGEEAEDAEQ